MPARSALEHDPHRPQFHFLPPANWMNDPNGLIEWNGLLHLFYQYNPHGAFHGTIHWGHAVSADRVHWQDLPIALAPTPGGADAEGCWSGCAVDNDGVPTRVYTGVLPQTVSVATGSPDLVEWQKLPGNPVIAGPPAWLQDASQGDFRDPFVWRDGDHWQMIIGCRSEGVGGLILLYRSPDLVHWTFVSTLFTGDAGQIESIWTGTIWECPNLLDFGDRQVLIISAQAKQEGLMYAFYATGRMQGGTFLPAKPPRMLMYGAVGGGLYAPQVTRLADGSYLLIGWLREERSEACCLQAGWSGLMSLPLQAALAPDGVLALTPDPALQRLRGQHWHFDEIALSDGADKLLEGVTGDCLEIVARFDSGNAAEFGLQVRCSPDGREYTRISVHSAGGQLVLGRDHASLDPEAHRQPCAAPLAASRDEAITLHIYLDRSVIEIFAEEGRTTLTGRIYPSLAESLGVTLFSRGGGARLQALDIWSMASIWAPAGA
jgi:beta-fructofuranosidase